MTGLFQSPSITFGSNTLTNSGVYITKYDSSGMCFGPKVLERKITVLVIRQVQVLMAVHSLQARLMLQTLLSVLSLSHVLLFTLIQCSLLNMMPVEMLFVHLLLQAEVMTRT